MWLYCTGFTVVKDAALQHSAKKVCIKVRKNTKVVAEGASAQQTTGKCVRSCNKQLVRESSTCARAHKCATSRTACAACVQPNCTFMEIRGDTTLAILFLGLTPQLSPRISRLSPQALVFRGKAAFCVVRTFMQTSFCTVLQCSVLYNSQSLYNKVKQSEHSADNRRRCMFLLSLASGFCRCFKKATLSPTP